MGDRENRGEMMRIGSDDQIWSMLAGYEEQAQRFNVWNLSNLVNASRL